MMMRMLLVLVLLLQAGGPVLGAQGTERFPVPVSDSFFGVGMYPGGNWGWEGYPYGYMYPGPFFGWPQFYSFAAIAYDTFTGRYGISVNQPDVWSAEQVALGYCGTSSCRSVVWVGNGCASVAVGSNLGLFGWSFNGSKYGALQNAIQWCSRQDAGCRTAAWVCTN